MTAHTRPGAAQRRHPRTAHRRTEGLRAIAPHDVTAEPGSTRTAAEAQRTYHHDLFGALWDRKTAARAIDGSGLRGLDQLGHFGADGCDLVVEAVAEHAPAGPLSVVELGCGLGGALRHVLTALSGRAEVARAVGVDVVEEHVRLTAESHAADPLSTPVTAVCAAAEDTGLPGGSFDVVFASGSLSHFTDVAAVVHEAYRLLRPAAC
ncbi:class I SAM-dependent methyltransferase [Streptomyces tubbatahanensis]|uniref:Class I SAM-dependent methyltransferase n=1 Tax=Streptomyces tubbatahanensis TaxID=2923272 RepID=A0ABY3XKX2_9ACTN|nr:class I SAM-dependent methyltransferase [Streptomyces tubbatahanensis]UNS95062.1 class I SAM-dependent methyltransferase [Streptomyces tubbatahanensis]